MSVSVRQIEALQCPTCKAAPGKRCTEKGQEIFHHHMARIAKATEAL